MTDSRSVAVAANTAEYTCIAGSQDSQVASLTASASPTPRTRATFRDVMSAPDLAPCDASIDSRDRARDFSITGTTAAIASVG